MNLFIWLTKVEPNFRLIQLWKPFISHNNQIILNENSIMKTTRWSETYASSIWMNVFLTKDVDQSCIHFRFCECGSHTVLNIHSTQHWCSSALVVVWLQVQASLYVCDFTDPVPQFSDTRVDARIVPPSAAFSPAHYSSLEPFANIGLTCKRAAGVSLWKPKETNF